MKTSFSFFVILILLAFNLGCTKGFKYTNIQRVPNSNTYIATGYFSNDPIPMLVNAEKWLSINTPMPENAYLPLSGSILDSVIGNLDTNQYYGAFVTLKGVQGNTKGFNRAKLTVESIEVNSNSTSDRGPSIINHCGLPPNSCISNPTVPPLCQISTGSPNKFALLFSGGKDEYNAKFRYWNDLEFMYLTLRSQYNFSDANMAVVYMDGRMENTTSQMQVDYPATVTGLNAAIAFLGNQMDLQGQPNVKDTFFIFVTNHGGGYDPNLPTELSGSVDNGGDEADNTSVQYDENIAYYKPAGSEHFIKDDFWKAKINTILNTRNPLMIAVYEPCFSGGFLRDMQGPNRVNIAAASQNGPSYALPPNNIYDAFSYYFTAALHGVHADGSCLVPSPDVDPPFGQISILEAYKYANLKDQGPTRRHFIDDSNDGIGVEGAPVVSFQGTGTGQGVFSKLLFLK
jgi:hypothetical protein